MPERMEVWSTGSTAAPPSTILRAGFIRDSCRFTSFSRGLFSPLQRNFPVPAAAMAQKCSLAALFPTDERARCGNRLERAPATAPIHVRNNITRCASAARTSFHLFEPGISGNTPAPEGGKWRAIRSNCGSHPTLPKTELWHPRHSRCSLRC